ncbi:MAG: hypothetical protein LBL74_04615 [Bacteroidales bacterium]|jgi:hypothetical protein|nr:hypothetical protein [Bacteroidales bacterium]
MAKTLVRIVLTLLPLAKMKGCFILSKQPFRKIKQPFIRTKQRLVKMIRRPTKTNAEMIRAK